MQKSNKFAAKTIFWGIKHSTSVLVQTKKNLFCGKFITFLHFFSFLAEKMLKMTILTSVRGVQHPNAGRNIQQTETIS